jgi:Flp pilus assembly protein TadG
VNIGSGRSQRAQSLVEFALVVPMFLLLVFALIDFSRLLFTYASVASGAREFARELALTTTWNATDSINAFKYPTIFAGSQIATQDGFGNQTGDRITVRMGDTACARALDLGGSCTTTPTSKTCPLPLSTSTCDLSTVKPPQGGFVEVTVNYTFQFNPLFQNRLAGVIDVSFMRPTAAVTTTSRAYAD